jgi:hypothetical protein
MMMAVHIHNRHGYIYDNMPLERPYEYVIVIILAHFKIDHLHLLAVACLQQNVARAALPGTALTARTCVDCAQMPSTRKTTAAPAGRHRRCSPRTTLPRMWPPTPWSIPDGGSHTRRGGLASLNVPSCHRSDLVVLRHVNRRRQRGCNF